MKYIKSGGVAISSQGESSTSEGYVYEAIMEPVMKELPLFVFFQDNGYGISVPKVDQTANYYAATNF